MQDAGALCLGKEGRKRGKAPRRLVAFLVVVALTLIAVEAGLQLAEKTLDPGSALFKSLENGLRYKGETQWLERYVESFGREGHRLALDEPNPRLGWSPRRNQRVTMENKTYTINEYGVRGPSPFTRDPAKYLILAIGDSFTFGVDAGDEETWPALLEAQDARLQVVNMGVAAYGTDQMALRLDRAVKNVKPHLVVAAFYDDDLNRALLGFRDFKKPRFILRDGELVLTNTPIGSPEEVFREAKDELARLSRSKLAILAHNLADEFVSWRDLERLNTRIFERMIAASHGQGAEFLLLYLPYREALRDPNGKSYGEMFFDQFTAAHATPALNPRTFFLAQQGAAFVRNHYTRVEAEIVARAVRERIAALDSFAAWR